MIWDITHPGKYRRTITKIKYDFDNAFRYNVFMMKSSESLNLPDGLDHIVKRSCWYVLVAVQIPDS